MEDHQLLADTLSAALAQQGISARVVPPEAHVALLSAIRTLAPDLVLLDLDLGEHGDSTPLIKPLARSGIRVLVVTGSADRLDIARALEQGAIGHQSKTAGFVPLVAKASQALAADRPLDAPERAELLDELRRWRAARARDLAPFERLTPREADTLRELVRGRSVGEVAAAWVVSEATVRSHVRGILEKLGVTSQIAAVGEAVRVRWPV